MSVDFFCHINFLELGNFILEAYVWLNVKQQSEKQTESTSGFLIYSINLSQIILVTSVISSVLVNKPVPVFTEIELIFFRVAHMVLYLGFVIKTVLMTQGCFSNC